MSHAPISMGELNQLGRAGFVAVCGPLFEHSPWIAERTYEQTPFINRDLLLSALIDTMHAATPQEKLDLIQAHPDLGGKLARERKLTESSTEEQAAAGVNRATPYTLDLLDTWNRSYRERFGFPFIICARENTLNDILLAFPARHSNTKETEIRMALLQIGKIAKYRLFDAVDE